MEFSFVSISRHPQFELAVGRTMISFTSDAPDFEKASLRACELIAARDPPDWQSARSTPPFAVEN